MRDDAEHPAKKHDEDEPRVINASFPEWAKFAMSIAGTVIIVLGYVEARFVSRVEWSNHDKQQIVDMARLQATQADYARAEVVTGQGLTDLKVDVAEIKGDVAWLRSYLDVSMPAPRRNGRARP